MRTYEITGLRTEPIVRCVDKRAVPPLPNERDTSQTKNITNDTHERGEENKRQEKHIIVVDAFTQIKFYKIAVVQRDTCTTHTHTDSV